MVSIRGLANECILEGSLLSLVQYLWYTVLDVAASSG
jgi:hypothetical protein